MEPNISTPSIRRFQLFAPRDTAVAQYAGGWPLGGPFAGDGNMAGIATFVSGEDWEKRVLVRSGAGPDGRDRPGLGAFTGREDDGAAAADPKSRRALQTEVMIPGVRGGTTFTWDPTPCFLSRSIGSDFSLGLAVSLMQMQMHCKALKRSDGRERTTVGDSAPFDERDVSWELSKSVCEATGRRAPTARPRMPVWPSLSLGRHDSTAPKAGERQDGSVWQNLLN